MLIAPSKSPSSHGSQSVKKTIDGLQIFVVVAIVVVVVVVVDATAVIESLSLVSLVVVKVLVLAMVAVGDDEVCCDIGVAKRETLIDVDEIKLESVDETLVA